VKNKYLVFISIGFELVALIMLSVWLGDYLVAQGYSKSTPAFCVLISFLLWFTSLIIKLKSIKK
jgi:hypothetical protein